MAYIYALGAGGRRFESCHPECESHGSYAAFHWAFRRSRWSLQQSETPAVQTIACHPECWIY